MVSVRKSEERGGGNYGWLLTRHVWVQMVDSTAEVNGHAEFLLFDLQ
jgi:hypothetical protein